jgi:hypothetical protein
MGNEVRDRKDTTENEPGHRPDLPFPAIEFLSLQSNEAENGARTGIIPNYICGFWVSPWGIDLIKREKARLAEMI